MSLLEPEKTISNTGNVIFCVCADKYRDGQVVLSKLEPESTNSDTGKRKFCFNSHVTDKTDVTRTPINKGKRHLVLSVQLLLN